MTSESILGDSSHDFYRRLHVRIETEASVLFWHLSPSGTLQLVAAVNVSKPPQSEPADILSVLDNGDMSWFFVKGYVGENYIGHKGND